MAYLGFKERRYFSVPDLAILLLLATVIYGIVGIANAWRAQYSPVTQIDLSVWALPYYTLLSGIRGVTAYLISLIFTLVVGYAAARSKSAEKVIIPLLDIFQSIPVLGFLPGLMIGLVAIFPHSNFGIELAAILMIFTGQVWNMTFSYYSSLKSIPSELEEASTVMGLNRWEKMFRLELPFSAVNLAWNSLLSMAGGWFFLNVCEAFTLGEYEFRLPGIGAYMDVAVRQGNKQAMFMAIVAMISLIVVMDFVVWRPILAWVKKFRLEELPGVAPAEPLMQIWIRESMILRYIRQLYHHSMARRGARRARRRWKKRGVDEFIDVQTLRFHRISDRTRVVLKSPTFLKWIGLAVWAVVICSIAYGTFRLFLVLIQIPPATWLVLFRDTSYTFFRILAALAIGTLWAVPFGIWIGISGRRTRVAQPIVQILASFPAPMLFPVILEVLFSLGVPLGVASMFLILVGVQWYILFNVLAGALRIPKHLTDAVSLMELAHWDRWKALYLPSIFPSLVTGWITAAGGAWNASIVAEYLHYQGTILKAQGLGSTLSVATANDNLPLFAASLTLMVVIVILLNRMIWSPLYNLAQTRYKMDL